MDLWDMFSRLWARKVGLALVLALALALGVIGWVTSSPSYSLTSSQALRATERTADGTRATTGSYELGMIGAMLVQNTASQQGAFGGAVVNSSNSVVSPPAALPLVTITVTSDSEQLTREAMAAAKQNNQQFLENLLAEGTTPATVSLVDMPGTEQPAASQRPRIRAAGVGAIFGGLGGLTLLLILDAVQHRSGRGKYGWTSSGSR